MSPERVDSAVERLVLVEGAGSASGTALICAHGAILVAHCATTPLPTERYKTVYRAVKPNGTKQEA